MGAVYRAVMTGVRNKDRGTTRNSREHRKNGDNMITKDTLVLTDKEEQLERRDQEECNSNRKE